MLLQGHHSDDPDPEETAGGGLPPLPAARRSCIACHREGGTDVFGHCEIQKTGMIRCIDCLDHGRPAHVAASAARSGGGRWRRENEGCVDNNPYAADEDSSSTATTTGVVPDTEAARRNEASSASFDVKELLRPRFQGRFRYAALGEYVDGPRIGQLCVCKWFKDGAIAQHQHHPHQSSSLVEDGGGSVYEKDFYEHDIRAMFRALEILDMFNRAKISSDTFKVNIPETWHFPADSTGGGPLAGRCVLQEPYIQDFTKFNSNTGWCPQPPPAATAGSDATTAADALAAWSAMMQALSHFSYHVTNGEHLLCDIQGGVYENSVILTDPVILSRTMEYGPTDLGPRGQESFFAHHTCGPFCMPHWIKPKRVAAYFAPQSGTSMMMPVEEQRRRHQPGRPDWRHYEHQRQQLLPPSPPARRRSVYPAYQAHPDEIYYNGGSSRGGDRILPPPPSSRHWDAMPPPPRVNMYNRRRGRSERDYNDYDDRPRKYRASRTVSDDDGEEYRDY
jgi:Alpha-kinase family